MQLVRSTNHAAPFIPVHHRAPAGFDSQQAISHMLSSLEAECAATALPGPATVPLTIGRETVSR